MEKYIHDVKTIVESMGKKIVNIEWYDNIYTWLNWYKGKVDNFHNYKIYNGQEYVEKTRYSMQMPKLISEDWATLLYNDRTTIKVDEKQQEKIDEILDNNDFKSRFSNFIEIMMALGIGAIVEYKDKKQDPKISFIVAPMVFPLRVEHGEIVDCVFASVVNGKYYINTHEKQLNGKYKITNQYYTFSEDGLNKPVKNKLKGIIESYISDVKLFQIFKPCITNNIDIFSPFGISVYANAIDRIKACDLVYDSLRNEFVLGKKRIFLREDLVSYKPLVREDGKTINVPTFDNNDVEFYSLPSDDNSQGEQIKEINSVLRTQEHINALQSELNMLSDACGLGTDRYNFQNGNVYTNTTQVISTQSKLYKTLLKHEKEIRGSMIQMIKALLYLKNNRIYEGDITIDFDDSIVEDTSVIQKRALLVLQSGVIDNVEYFVQVYKYTKEQAEEFAKEIQKRQLEKKKAMSEEEPTPEDDEAQEKTEEDNEE